MPRKNAGTMSLRLEFVQLACQDGSNVSQLCRQFGISRETGYKWPGSLPPGAAVCGNDRV